MQDSKSSRTGRTRLEFTNELALDTFCVTCVQNNVPIAYGTDLSISIPTQVFQQLPPAAHTQFKFYEKLGEVFVKDEPLPSRSRKVLTTEESRAVLRQLIPEEFLPKP